MTHAISPRFSHENDVTVGKGRIPYIEDPFNGRCGWPLPGGKWTDSRSVAVAAASAIDRHARQHEDMARRARGFFLPYSSQSERFALAA